MQSTIKLKGLPLGLPLIITRKRKKPETSRFLAFHQAGDERIELPPKVLETPIIPLDQSPIFCFCTPLLGTHYLYHIPYVSVNRIFHFFVFFQILSTKHFFSIAFSHFLYLFFFQHLLQ